jgi:L-alanine-DL-glutamate epimerase-like enolase superfamily enzyme
VGAAVEIALWDLAGRILAVPTYRLLGARRTSLPSYVISAEDFLLKSVAEYVDLAQRYVAGGFRACKFHMWGDAKRDIAACTAIRKAVGDEVALMLDPAGRYGRTDAVRVAHAIAELGFVRLEDPLPPEDAAGYRWLASRVSLPVVANETLLWNAEQCAAAARDGVVQGFRLNVGRAGIAEALRMDAIAEASGAELDIAAFVPRGGLEACLHVALAARTSRWFEHHEALGLEEVPGISPGLAIERGVASPADAPGLGFRVERRLLDDYCRWV